MPEKRYYNLRDAAEYLDKGISVMRAHAETQNPDDYIPAIRDGRRIKFDVEDLDAYMKRKKDR